MKQQESEDKPRRSSLRTLIIFCVVVASILVIALTYRVIYLVQQSKFDGSSGFIVASLQSDGKKAVIYAFDPQDEHVAVVSVSGKISGETLSKQLLLPIDGYLTQRAVDDKQFPLETKSYEVYNPEKRTDLSLIDVIRLWWLFRGTQDSHITRFSVTVPVTGDSFDSQALEMFRDTALENEKKTIAIINGTPVSGLGGRLEKSLSRVGSEVISVTTAHQTIPQSRIIYYGERSYTIQRLSRMLAYPVEERQGSSLSDIIIEIGADEQRTTAF